MDSAPDAQAASLASKLSPTKTSVSRAQVQAKTFTKWINAHLRKCDASISDLFEDLRDGVRLLQLTEVLTGEKLRREKGVMRVHHLANLNRALDYLRMRKNIKLVNIDAGDLADGSEKLTLGLVWMLIQHFHIAASAEQAGGDQWADAKSALLEWCRECVRSYENVSVNNFSDSWRDGRAFNAIVHRFRPDLVDFASLKTASSPDSSEAARADLRAVFAAAERELGVEALLEAEDVNVDSPDDRSIMMYVAMLRNVLGDVPEDGGNIPDGSADRSVSAMAKATPPPPSQAVPPSPLIPVVEEQDGNGGDDYAEVGERPLPLPSHPSETDEPPAGWREYLPGRAFCLGLVLFILPIVIEVVRRRNYS